MKCCEFHLNSSKIAVGKNNNNSKVNSRIVFTSCFIALCIVYDFSFCYFLSASLTLPPHFVCYILQFQFEFSEIFSTMSLPIPMQYAKIQNFVSQKVIVKWLSAIAAAKLFKSEGKATDGWDGRDGRGGEVYTLPNVKSTQKYIRIVCKRVRKFNKLNWHRSCSEPAITVSDTISNLHLFIHTAEFAHTHTDTPLFLLQLLVRSFCQSILKFAADKKKMGIKVLAKKVPRTNAHFV